MRIRIVPSTQHGKIASTLAYAAVALYTMLYIALRLEGPLLLRTVLGSSAIILGILSSGMGFKTMIQNKERALIDIVPIIAAAILTFLVMLETI